MKSFSALLGLSLFFSLQAQALFTHHIIQEPTDGGKVKYTVIEEDLSLRDKPDQISQYVIFKKISFANDPNIMTEAMKYSVGLKDMTNSFLKDFDTPMAPPPPPPPAAKPLWTAIKNTWTAQDEKDYQTWFEATVTTEFNKGTALLADCADVALLFRWAYAHDKKLPVANTLSGSGKLFGHFSSSSNWDKLPSDPDWRKDERFKQAMRYLFDNAYTQSVFTDLYPTQINSTYVHPGSIYMIIREKSGHAQTIHKIDAKNAGMRSLWGNEPSAESIYSSYFIWEPAVKNLFGSWRWPVYQDGAWKLISAKNMPGYSDEQFAKRKDLGEDLFQVWVLSGLGLVDFEEVKISREIQTVKEAIEYRIKTTAIAAMICGYTPCNTSGADYDNHSTNSRDARLLQSQAALLKTVASAGGINADSVVHAIAKADVAGIVIQGFPYTFKDFIFSEALLKNIKPEANLTFNQRWGLNQFTSKTAQFKMLEQQLKINLLERMDAADSASYYCVTKTCDPSSATITALSTAQVDRGFVALANQLIPLVNEPEINQGTLLEETYEAYRDVDASSSYPERVTSPLCENPVQCTMFDVIWSPGALNRVKTWKSQPIDSPASRWGL